MPSTMSSAERSMEHKAFDYARPLAAPPGLDSQPLSIEMTALVRDALVRTFGSLKAAAIEMRMDQGQLTRELDAGKLNLARLQRCGAAFLLKFGALMVEHAQPLSTPRARYQDLLNRRRSLDAEFEQFAAYIAS